MNAATAQRIPPHNDDAEQSLLGSMLLAPAAIDAVVDVVRADHFYRPAHGHVYDAVTALYATGRPADAVTVADELARRELLDAVGGPSALTDLLGATPAIGNAARYADIVVDLARQRSLIGVAGEIAELGYQPTTDVDTVVDRAEQLMFEVSDAGARTSAINFGGTLDAWLDRLVDAQTNGRLPGIATGFDDIDSLTLGMQPGQLVVVAARPGMGKTSLGADIARHASQAGHPTLLVSIEMGLEELQNRLVSAQAHVDLQRIRGLKLAANDWPRLTAAIDTVRSAPLDIVDDGHVNLITIRSHARRVARRYGRPPLVIVDYVQLMKAVAKHNNREGEVAEAARGLKLLARELGTTVIALAQLNRGVEQRADKRPMLSDLRESGEIENAADVVAFIYRDEMYNPQSPDRGIAEIIVAKQRNGPTGFARLAWLDRYSTFANMVRT